MIPLGDADVQRRTFPYVTVALILINAVVFVYEFSLSDLEQHIFILKNGLIPAELTSGQEFHYLGNRFGDSLDILSPFGTWATLLTSMFLHGGWLHIIFNMLFLWGFGGNVEDRVGHVKYLVFYLVAGLAASMAQVGIDMDSRIPMVGASGAIAGVLGAYLILHPFNRINVLIIFVFITAVRVPAGAGARSVVRIGAVQGNSGNVGAGNSRRRRGLFCPCGRLPSRLSHDGCLQAAGPRATDTPSAWSPHPILAWPAFVLRLPTPTA